MATVRSPRGPAEPLGVLLTGYLLKRGYWGAADKRRYGVLTHTALHFFNRKEGEDLFGEERGLVNVADIKKVEKIEGHCGFRIIAVICM